LVTGSYLDSILRSGPSVAGVAPISALFGATPCHEMLGVTWSGSWPHPLFRLGGMPVATALKAAGARGVVMGSTSK
jgi:hypothetical protein